MHIQPHPLQRILLLVTITVYPLTPTRVYNHHNHHRPEPPPIREIHISKTLSVFRCSKPRLGRHVPPQPLRRRPHPLIPNASICWPSKTVVAACVAFRLRLFYFSRCCFSLSLLNRAFSLVSNMGPFALDCRRSPLFRLNRGPSPSLVVNRTVSLVLTQTFCC